MKRAGLYCLIALVLAAAGCGQGEGISPENATALVANLDSVERGARAGECERTRPAMAGLERRVQALPSDVDAEVRSTLEGGVQNLGRLFKTQCRQKPKPVPEPIAEPTFDTTPEPEVTEPEPEPEAAPEPESDPTPEEPAPEPEPEKAEPEEQQEAKPEKPAKEPEEDNAPPKEEDLCGDDPSPTC